MSDYKGDIPGSLFMAAQTYVWDHQTFKGEGDGDIDGGGYANADTYETYLGYIDWMLSRKSKGGRSLPAPDRGVRRTGRHCYGC